MNAPQIPESFKVLFGEEVFEAMRVLVNQIGESVQDFADSLMEMAVEMKEIPYDGGRIFWREAAAFACSRMAARAQAFARQMDHQKARQAMKRRKLLHAEGHLPD